MNPEHEASLHCLDAETMAAWVDHALPAADAAATDAHVADCARCQQVLAVLVTSMPAMPAMPIVAQPAPWWRRRWVVGSLVPLAAGSLALALWIAVPGQPPAPVTTLTPPAAPSPARALSEGVRPESAPARASQAAAADSKRESAPVASADELRRRDEPATPPAAPVPQAAADAAQTVAAEPPRAPAMRAAAAPTSNAAAPTLNKVVAAVDVVSPDPSIRWRIGAAGSISYSADGGATWTGQTSGVRQDLAAGTSPRAGTCWVVGRAGTVLLSIDGNTWRSIPFPEAVDLTGVDARDATAATVTAADGRRFQTADGGRTWARLQDF